MPKSTIALAGATGDLGGRIARALLARGARVRAIVRPESDRRRLAALRRRGVTVIEVPAGDERALRAALRGSACLVSALSGLREVIVDYQEHLARAAADAGVPRIIPSDYSIDFTRLPAGSNRNLDHRREFWSRLEDIAIAPTTIFNGAFADLLTGQMPLIVYPLHRVVYWGDADTPMDFTTRNDTAAFTAAAALDPDAPRILRIAGGEVSPRDLAREASEAMGEEFTLFRTGPLGALKLLIKATRAVAPGKDDVYPPWQGMQYMHNMLSGRAKFEALDNARYSDIRFTSVRAVLRRHARST